MERNHLKTSITSSVLSLNTHACRYLSAFDSKLGSGCEKGCVTIDRELASNTVLWEGSDFAFNIFVVAMQRETILVVFIFDWAFETRFVFQLEPSWDKSTVFFQADIHLEFGDFNVRVWDLPYQSMFVAFGWKAQGWHCGCKSCKFVKHNKIIN